MVVVRYPWGRSIGSAVSGDIMDGETNCNDGNGSSRTLHSIRSHNQVDSIELKTNCSDITGRIPGMYNGLPNGRISNANDFYASLSLSY